MDSQITFLFRVTKRTPAHTYVSVFAGTQERSRGLCGTLKMRNDEWEVLVDALPLEDGVVRVETAVDLLAP